jgi:hypothetical protein
MCVRVCGTCGRVPRLRVDVVVDASVMLADCGPMEPARVLRDRALPRDQECEHERVESGVVEALAEVAARRDDRGGPAAFGELGERSSTIGGSQAAVQFGEVRDLGSEQVG